VSGFFLKLAMKFLISGLTSSLAAVAARLIVLCSSDYSLQIMFERNLHHSVESLIVWLRGSRSWLNWRDLLCIRLRVLCNVLESFYLFRHRLQLLLQLEVVAVEPSDGSRRRVN
jgi:hypothetical protein